MCNGYKLPVYMKGYIGAKKKKIALTFPFVGGSWIYMLLISKERLYFVVKQINQFVTKL